jgi:sulfur carrier protein
VGAKAGDAGGPASNQGKLKEAWPTVINLMVNGKPREVENNIDLQTYLTSFDVNLKFVAVGYNGEVIKKERFPEIVLKNGDVLEIVRPVGGG